MDMRPLRFYVNVLFLQVVAHHVLRGVASLFLCGPRGFPVRVVDNR